MHLSTSMKKHWMTTLFGWITATGTLLAAAGAASNKPTLTILGTVLAAVGQAGGGTSAADANKVPNGNGRN